MFYSTRVTDQKVHREWNNTREKRERGGTAGINKAELDIHDVLNGEYSVDSFIIVNESKQMIFDVLNVC